MKDEHIINLLESKPFSHLSDSEMAIVYAHVAHCDGCGRAIEAAHISTLLIKERAALEFAPSPFFETRVMAAWRERPASTETLASGFWRLWKATGALVPGMAATVAALAVLTFFAPSLESTPPDITSALNANTAEEVILARVDLPEDDLSYDQVLTTIYESDAER